MVILGVGEEVLEEKALVGEIHAGDEAVMVATNIKDHVVRPHPARRGEGVSNVGEGAEGGPADDGVPVFQRVGGVWRLVLNAAEVMTFIALLSLCDERITSKLEVDTRQEAVARCPS